MSINPPHEMSSLTDRNELKPATTSISKTLLKIVFTLYLVIAILLTCIHMFTEYRNTKNRIDHSLVNIEEVVYKSLSVTLWNYNIEAISSILEGLRRNEFLEGALITMPTGEQMGFGHIMREQGEIYAVSENNELIEKDMSYIDSKFFGHDFPIYYLRDNGKKEFVGHMYVYSSHARVIHSVKSIFTLIVITAIIKTLALWFIFVWAIKTRLSDPLKSFVRFMKKFNIESSTYEPVDIQSSDRNELKLLEETFNHMLQRIMVYQTSLEEKEEKLSDMNENLSHLVEHRTMELDAANDDLLIQNDNLKEALGELERTQKELAYTAHKAGMAEVSSGMLHTIGSALNSVNIHNQTLASLIQDSKLDVLLKVNKNFGIEFSEFRENIKNSGKEEIILELYHSTGPTLSDEKNKLLDLLRESNEKIRIMMATLKAQRKYAEYDRLIENVNIKEVLLDSMTIAVHEIDEIDLSITGDDSLVIRTEKNKLLNVLVNLIINARDSVLTGDVSKPEIKISFYLEGESLIISIMDNGPGIDESHLLKIFNFGFSTRENRDGFGLHNSANQVREIGGEVKVVSNPQIKETVFTLILPVKNDK